MEIQNSKFKIIFFSILFLGVFSLAGNSKAAVLFEDNFDARADSHAILGEDNDIGPDNVWEWTGQDPATSATFDGVTHYANEISSPGRGDTGKSLKMWRHSSYYPLFSGLYSNYAANHITAPAHFFMRYNTKLPVAFDFTDCNWNKWWRLNTSSGAGEIYLYFGSSTPGGSLRETGYISMVDSSSELPFTILNNVDLKAIWDGDWHCWEFEIDTANSILRLWIDGVLKYNTPHTWSATGTITGLQHLGGGNVLDWGTPPLYEDGSHTAHYQNSWQAMEMDDFVLATNPTNVDKDGHPMIGPTDWGGSSDTTPPATPSGLVVN